MFISVSYCWVTAMLEAAATATAMGPVPQGTCQVPVMRPPTVKALPTFHCEKPQ
jgi:hypothetical protein